MKSRYVFSFFVKIKIVLKEKWRLMDVKDKFIKNLHNPPKQYRPIPFWSWNEKLDTDETRRQIKEMERVGIGGYFMHARGGLKTPYMGQEWMENIEAGIDEGRNNLMGAWLYDENGWPSGFGDGKINGLGEEFQQKYLRYEIVQEEKILDNGRTITNQVLDDGQILHFYYDVNPFYVDTLDDKVIKRFLEEIYLPYYERFQKDFGSAMPGFFTDEPQVSRNGIPWSFILEEKYFEVYGQELLPVLPQLFLNIGQYKRTRYQFWHLIQELFVTNFTEQIYNWCDEHNSMLTGHMVLEETLLSQLTSNGAVMPHYEFFHIPGMDWLSRYIGPPTTPLQVSSVSHQLGKKQILSETFALTGWNVTFEELKWMFELQMVRGITQLCQHLEGYSLRGIRKRDYPPSLFYQQPWWDKYRSFNDAVSRIVMILAEGEVNFNVLVIHPQSSAWLNFSNSNNHAIEAFYKQFIDVTKALEENHVLFHYGDERILHRHGKVVEESLIIGTQEYAVVIVPPVETLSETTVSLLQEYAENNGNLIWVEKKPSLVGGQKVDGLKTGKGLVDILKKGVDVKRATDITNQLPPEICRISVSDQWGKNIGAILATERSMPEGFDKVACRFYFFANSSLGQGYDGTIRVPGKSVRVFDPQDGSIKNIPYSQEDNEVVLHQYFHPMGSLTIFVGDEELFACEDTIADLSACTALQCQEFDDQWDITIKDPNALTLDYCDFWFDDELQAKDEHISVIQKRALDLQRPVKIGMRFEINVAPNYTPNELWLVIERPDLYKIELNGSEIENEDCGYYKDKSFRKIDISGKLKPGKNVVLLETMFTQSPQVYEQLRKAVVFEAEKNKLTYDHEIEALYLVGDFGVETSGEFTPLSRGALRYKGEFLITPAPDKVYLGDLTPQGLPFFGGTVCLRKQITLKEHEIKGRSLKLKDKMANIVGVRINGKYLKDIYWRPYEVNLEGFLKAGENIIELELTGSLRNLLGPHHLEEGESYAVAPPCFFKEPNVWGNSPWNDNYCFVRFGVTV